MAANDCIVTLTCPSCATYLAGGLSLSYLDASILRLRCRRCSILVTIRVDVLLPHVP